MRIVHLTAFQTLKIGLAGMGTWMIQMRARMTGKQTRNKMWNWTMAVRVQKPRRSRILVPH
jgi:hypothetical protein